MALPTVTAVYRLIEEPELKFGQSGTAVCRVRLAANSSKKDESGQWVDADQLFINATAFGAQAEAITDAGLTKGQEVLVSGRLRTNAWENQQGEKRSVIELRLDSIGPTIRPPKGDRSGGQPPAGQGFGQQPAQPPGGDMWAGGTPDNPPF